MANKTAKDLKIGDRSNGWELIHTEITDVEIYTVWKNLNSRATIDRIFKLDDVL